MDSFSQLQDVLTYYECEKVIPEINSVKLKNYGDKQWMKQHELLTKLNMQAHINAMTRGEEFVMELLSVNNKMPIILHELLVSECWKKKILPFINNEVMSSGIKGYFAVFNEAVVINLLEVILYHRTAIEGLGNYLVDLIEYCYGKLTDLNNKSNKQYPLTDVSTGSQVEQYKNTYNKIEFEVQMSCISIIRYISDNIKFIPLGVVSYLMNEKDFLLILVPLIESKPWSRDNKGKKEVWEDNKFVEIPKSDYNRLTKAEGQIWLAIYNLLFTEESANSYEINDFRKNNLLRLRKYLQEVLMDQIPVLSYLKKTLDELTIMKVNAQTKSNVYVVQSVPELYQHILDDASISDVIKYQKENIFGNMSTNEDLEILNNVTDIYSHQVVDMKPVEYICANCGIEANKRCSRCKSVWYCCKECQVQHYKAGHKDVCNKIAETIKNSGGVDIKLAETKVNEIKIKDVSAIDYEELN